MARPAKLDRSEALCHHCRQRIDGDPTHVAMPNQPGTRLQTCDLTCARLAAETHQNRRCDICQEWAVL